MGLFNFSKKKPEQQPVPGPYKENSTNLIYQLLFCDSLDLYKANTKPPFSYPFDILFSDQGTIADLQTIIDDTTSDPRIKVLAYNRQMALGQKPAKKELMAVIIEVGLDLGLDVLASFRNGTARYINQIGRIIIWEMSDETSERLTSELFSKSREIIEQIGPWDKPRRTFPPKGMARISFLVSDGLYFGEAPVNTLFNDPLAASALNTAAELMKYITEKSLKANKK